MKIVWISRGTGIYPSISDFYKKHPDSYIESINGKVYLGCCESCLQPIVEGEEYQTWEDGIITHKHDCRE